MALGCGQELQAQIRIQDFATGETSYSSDACHRDFQEDEIPLASFCRLTDDDDLAKQQCSNFYNKQLVSISSGQRGDSHISICPMGLAVLSVPITDESHSNVFGALTCGPWVEKGTEGMLSDSILHYAMPENRVELTRASRKVEKLNRRKLKRARDTLKELAGHLGYAVLQPAGIETRDPAGFRDH